MANTRRLDLQDAGDRRLVVIANPTAGINAGRPSQHRPLQAARKDLENAGFLVELHTEPDPVKVQELAARAVGSGFLNIVAAGGDGTINAVVNGIMSQAENPEVNMQAVRLGILPFGTGNVFAYNLGIGKTWREACQVIRAGNSRPIDVGLACANKTNEAGEIEELRRHFLLMAGIGFDAKVIEDTSLRLKYVLRDFAYVLKILQNVVVHQGTQMTLRFADGRIYANESWMVMVGNAASYAWDLKFTAHARLDDGMVDVCLMPYQNKLVSVQQVVQILTGQHVENGDAEYWKVPGVTIESEPPVPVQLDGDEWAQTPVKISVSPSALHFLAPPELNGN